MPRLWEATVDQHRAAVRSAVLSAVSTVVAARGLSGLTMSELAQVAGIGRATLYKYFPDLAAVLTAWHEDIVEEHVQLLSSVADRESDPAARLRAVLTAYGRLRSHQLGPDLDAQLHSGSHVDAASSRVRDLFTAVLEEAAAHGVVTDSYSPPELASFCENALRAAAEMNDPGRAAELTLRAIAP